MDLKDRLTALVRTLPPAQRVGIVVGVAVLVMAAVPFVRWVTAPSYALLYSGLDDASLAGALDELEANGTSYQLDGDRVLVPRADLHRVRADLAQAGVSASPTVPGYELLDQQALGASDLRQRVDLQRAVEGELARTLGAMDGIDSATVRLVLPEDTLFTDAQEPASASVLVRTRGSLGEGQVEAITLLVSSAVEGLETDAITVADTAGQVLHAPGDGGTLGTGDRTQQRTQTYERQLAAELTAMVQQATGSAASVVVRADLDHDEVETETETFADDAVALREATTGERYEGSAPPVGGAVGVDGGPVAGVGTGDGTYERDEATREFGVDRVVTRTVRAPGIVDGLSVALVVDRGAEVTDAVLEDLVVAAAGMDLERGDSVAISRVAVAPVDAPVAEEPGAFADQLPTLVALGVLALVALGLFLMARRRRGGPDPAEEKVVPAELRPTPELDPPGEDVAADDDTVRLDELVTVGATPGPSVHDEVAELVERQPEEIAALLRSWLADRRSTVR